MSPTEVTGLRTIWRGGDWTLPVEFVDLAGDPINMSGWSWQAEFRPCWDSKVSFPCNIDATDEATGNIILRLSSEQTFSMPRGEYQWDLFRIRDSDGFREPLLFATILVDGAASHPEDD